MYINNPHKCETCGEDQKLHYNDKSIPIIQRTIEKSVSVNENMDKIGKSTHLHQDVSKHHHHPNELNSTPFFKMKAEKEKM